MPHFRVSAVCFTNALSRRCTRSLVGHLHGPLGSYGISCVLLGSSRLSRGRSYGQQDFLDFVFRTLLDPKHLDGLLLDLNSNLYFEVEKDKKIYVCLSLLCMFVCLY